LSCAQVWPIWGAGYGWFVGTAAGRRSYFHPVDNPGYLAFNAWLPDHDIRLAVLVNDETTDLDELLGELLRLAVSNQTSTASPVGGSLRMPWGGLEVSD
jgi:hypothetical protein